MKEKDRQRLSHLLYAYRSAKNALEAFKAEHFGPGVEVTGSSIKRESRGTIVIDGTCRLDYVAVKIPNGNTWHFPIESVHPIKKDNE